MHNIDIDLSLDGLSKIEGHGALDLKVRDSKVEYIKFMITEPRRFYTTAVEGKSCLAAPAHMSRICGTCSIAHTMCCIEAIEKALDIVPSKEAMLLKKLTMYGMMIRDHALHLYMFSLPDVLNKDSILDLDESDQKENELLHQAFEIKAAGNNLSKLVAGRAVHATHPTIGGFLKVPSAEESKAMVAELKKVRPYIFTLLDIFARWEMRLERETTFMALVTDDFSFLDGTIQNSKGHRIEEKSYADHLENVVIPYSNSTGYKFEEGNYFVGALSRLNLNKASLHNGTKRDAGKYLAMFPSKNIFHNDLAQAIEILHSIDHSIEILENTVFSLEKRQPPKMKPGRGVGVIEAPRGTLYYLVQIGEKGEIVNAEVIVPTQQNQINIENDIKAYVEQNLHLSKEMLTHRIEMIIRAYDPCMSCATHFLNINWI
ncbi:MAG: Ni/Fe hydrogenase subunit alpha [Nanoarchaeota archaeon]|nr:Ni/Fe hydrogenase subunit alpha [Nanoarchaeota archaeon]